MSKIKILETNKSLLTNAQGIFNRILEMQTEADSQLRDIKAIEAKILDIEKLRNEKARQEKEEQQRAEEEAKKLAQQKAAEEKAAAEEEARKRQEEAKVPENTQPKEERPKEKVPVPKETVIEEKVSVAPKTETGSKRPKAEETEKMCIRDRYRNWRLKMTEQKLESRLGYSFRNRELLRHALTHPSCGNAPNYERLEFLGDAVIAVSYTHLDVYKRQVQQRFPRSGPFIPYRRLPALCKIPAHHTNDVICTAFFTCGFNVIGMPGMKRVIFCDDSGNFHKIPLQSNAFYSIIYECYYSREIEILKFIL